MWSAVELGAWGVVVLPREKKPDMIAVLRCLLEHDTAGDPMTGLRWSIAVSPDTVARRLHAMGYSLRINQKQISTSSSPNRNLQFEYLAELRERFQRHHLPIINHSRIFSSQDQPQVLISYR
jgi:hypothetical protein